MDVLRSALRKYSIEVLREASKRAGSQAALADEIGENQQTVNHWIKNGAFPLKNLLLLAQLQRKRIGEVMRDLARACDEIETEPALARPRPTRRPAS